MSALLRRLLRTTKTVSNGLPQQVWRWLESTRWALDSGGKEAALNSGTVGTTASWSALNNDSVYHSVADNKKYYFEVKIAKYDMGGASGLRIGVMNASSNRYFFIGNGNKCQGTYAYGSSNFQAYMTSQVEGESPHRWFLYDVIGCSIENVGGNTVVRYYINGVEAGLDGAIGWTITGTPNLKIALSGFRYTSANEIWVSIEDLRYLPNGFEPW